MSIASTSALVEENLTRKYADATQWLNYGNSLLSSVNQRVAQLLNTDTVTANLQDLTAAMDNIPSYTPPPAFDYTPPDLPTFSTIPTYTSTTMGTIASMPSVVSVNVPTAPDTTVTFGNELFDDTLVGTLRAKLAETGTGLGSVENDLFAREVARQNTMRAKAYNEITTQFSSRGFDMPPGAILAKQTEANNESNIRLTDTSTGIMAESAKLAQSWNLATLSGSNALLDILARVFDSKIMRDFEAAKTTVMMAIEGFKQAILVETTKAQLNATSIQATTSYNEGVVKTFVAEVEAKTSPIKALAESNKAIAEAYDSQVKGASAALQALTIPEEMKIKGYGLNVQIAQAKADVISKEVGLAMDSALRQLQVAVSALNAQGDAAKQIIASALNSVNVSVSAGLSGSESDSTSESVSEVTTTSN